MSTQSRCVILEITPDRWFYLLENPSVSTEDWRAQAFAHGPFSSDDFAQEHLRQTYPLPSTQHIWPLDKGLDRYDLDQDPVLATRLEALRRH